MLFEQLHRTGGRQDLPVAFFAILQAVVLLAGLAAPGTIPDRDLRGEADARAVAELLFAQGRLAWADADLETALARDERAAATWPEDATYTYFAGHAALRLGRTGQAVLLLVRALPPARSSVPAWRARADVGMAYYLNGEAAAAEPYLRQALQEEPEDGTTLFYCGLVLLELGRLDESSAMFEKARARVPVLTADSHYYVGVAAFRSGELERARREFEEALDASHAVRHSIPEIRSNAKRYLEILATPEPKP